MKSGTDGSPIPAAASPHGRRCASSCAVRRRYTRLLRRSATRNRLRARLAGASCPQRMPHALYRVSSCRLVFAANDGQRAKTSRDLKGSPHEERLNRHGGENPAFSCFRARRRRCLRGPCVGKTFQRGTALRKSPRTARKLRRRPDRSSRVAGQRRANAMAVGRQGTCEPSVPLSMRGARGGGCALSPLPRREAARPAVHPTKPHFHNIYNHSTLKKKSLSPYREIPVPFPGSGKIRPSLPVPGRSLPIPHAISRLEPAASGSFCRFGAEKTGSWARKKFPSPKSPLQHIEIK